MDGEIVCSTGYCQCAAKDAEIARLTRIGDEANRAGRLAAVRADRAEAEVSQLRAALDRTCCAEHRETRKRLDAVRQEVAAVCDSMEGPSVASIGRAVGISYNTVKMWARLLRAALAEGKE